MIQSKSKVELLRVGNRRSAAGVCGRMVLLSVSLVLGVAVFAAPRLVVPPEGIALGEIATGEESHGAVQLRNTGDSPLHVTRVKACCGATAELVPMVLPPGGAAELAVTLKPQFPGALEKSVQVISDDPANPVVSIPVTGRAVEGVAPSAASRFTLPVLVLAGVVDGFNPCSFSIMIALAGILAIGGRRRRARILGGLSFCLASFLTYVAMGLGLMRALRALEGLRTLHDAVMVILALALFVLSYLSFRDAVRFRRVPVFSVVTLRLPEGVRTLIRRIAAASWRGPAVVAAGLGCGFLVTLLDALCTGQVYVPVLALISREPGAGRAFAWLVVYNLAFIAPLVAVFVLASRTADAFQMAKWSSRNVVPAKIALGFLFALLGTLVLPRLGSRLAGLVVGAA